MHSSILIFRLFHIHTGSRWDTAQPLHPVPICSRHRRCSLRCQTTTTTRKSKRHMSAQPASAGHSRTANSSFAAAFERKSEGTLARHPTCSLCSGMSLTAAGKSFQEDAKGFTQTREHSHTVIVIGAGVAGLLSALHFSMKPGLGFHATIIADEPPPDEKSSSTVPPAFEPIILFKLHSFCMTTHIFFVFLNISFFQYIPGFSLPCILIFLE